MLVPLKVFYEEVKGDANFSAATAVRAMQTLEIPIVLAGTGNGRKHYRVDLSHLELAKARWEALLHKPVRHKKATNELYPETIARVFDRLGSLELAVRELREGLVNLGGLEDRR